MKKCSVCKILLPLTDFTLDNKSKDKLKADCRKCRSLYMKARRPRILEKIRKQSRDWAKNNPDKVADSAYRRSYGISLEDFKVMVEKQEGKCLLCYRIPKDKLVIDHDHVTDRIRGLLCRSCNGALGVLGDNSEKLHKVIEYLEKI